MKDLARRLTKLERTRRREGLRATGDDYRATALTWLLDTGRLGIEDGRYVAKDPSIPGLERIAALLNTAAARRAQEAEDAPQRGRAGRLP